MDWSGSGQGQVTQPSASTKCEVAGWATISYSKRTALHKLLITITMHQSVYRWRRTNRRWCRAPPSLYTLPDSPTSRTFLTAWHARTHAQTSATSKLSLQPRLHTLKMETLTCMSWPTRHSVTTDWHQLPVEGSRCLHFATWAWQSSVSTMMSPSFRQKTAYAFLPNKTGNALRGATPFAGFPCISVQEIPTAVPVLLRISCIQKKRNY
jgi:hypothetical protein